MPFEKNSSLGSKQKIYNSRRHTGYMLTKKISNLRDDNLILAISSQEAYLGNLCYEVTFVNIAKSPKV